MKLDQIKLALSALVIGLFITFDQAAAQSALDGFDPNANGAIRAVVVQPDGKILIGGDFTVLSPNGGAAVARNYIARLNANGTLDTGFSGNATGSVHAIALQADGKVLVGGFFVLVGGQPRNNIARLSGTTGLADNTFNPNSSAGVHSIVVQPDGKILVGGLFSGPGGQIGGQPREHLARLDGTTGLADSFNTVPNNAVFSTAIQQDGKILAVGAFTFIGGQLRNGIARLDAATGLADAWNPNADSNVNTVAVQPDGKILVGGAFSSIGGQARNCIARLDPATGLPDPFAPDANSTVLSIVVQPDGKILAGADFSIIGAQSRSKIARLDPATGAADSFDPNTNSSFVYSIAVQADRKVLAGGDFTAVSPNGGAAGTRNRIVRLEPDGLLDRMLDDLDTSGGSVVATAIQPDGKILIGGGFTVVLGVVRNRIARLNTDGTLDTGFNPNADSFVYSIALQPDGKVLVGGLFTTIGGQPRNRIARLDATTGLADSFDPDANGAVYSIAVQPDGKILAAGQFFTIGTQTRQFIARLHAGSGLADSFNPHAENGHVNSIALQSDGKILAGGEFNAVGGQARQYIARLDGVSGLADSWDPNAGFYVHSLAVQSDGKILAGGQFTTIGAQTRNGIARLDAVTGLADSWNPNADSTVVSIAVQSDGKVLAGGTFGAIGGQGRNRIARLDGGSGLADSWNPNANGTVFSIAVQSDGKILAGGAFFSIGGETRFRFARLTNDTPALSALVVSQTTLTLTRDGSAPQFARVIFEQSVDNGASYTPLGTATNSLGFRGGNASVNERAGRVSAARESSFAPQAAGYTLAGQNIPTGQNVLIRARGFYNAGYQNGSETTEDKVRQVFFLPVLAANVSVSGRVTTANGAGVRNAIVQLTGSDGIMRRTITSSFGYYRFDNVQAGETYVIGVASKRYSFTPRTITVPDELTDVDFMPEP